MTDATLSLAAPAASVCAQPGDLVSAIESEKTGLASRLAAEEAALGQEPVELARMRAQRDELEAWLQRIARHAELGAAGREFPVLVRRELGALPRPKQIALEARQRELTRESAFDASVRAENEALALADLEVVIGRRLDLLCDRARAARARHGESVCAAWAAQSHRARSGTVPPGWRPWPHRAATASGMIATTLQAQPFMEAP